MALPYSFNVTIWKCLIELICMVVSVVRGNRLTKSRRTSHIIQGDNSCESYSCPYFLPITLVYKLSHLDVSLNYFNSSDCFCVSQTGRWWIHCFRLLRRWRGAYRYSQSISNERNGCLRVMKTRRHHEERQIYVYMLYVSDHDVTSTNEGITIL